MARSLFPKRRRKRHAAEFRNSLRLGVVIAALVGVNMYVFFFRPDTSFHSLKPQMTGKSLVDEKKKVIEETAVLPASVPSTASSAKTAAKAATAAVSPASAPLTTEPESGHTIEGKIGAQDTLGTVLEREGFGPAAANVIKALSRVFDPKLMRAGDSYAAALDDEGNPESFEYAPTPVVRYIVTPKIDGTWIARKEEKTLEVKAEEASGVIESSLYESIHKAGESAALVSLLVDLFAWDLNFYIDTHPQDHWRVVIEKQYLGGQFYKYGHILAAEYGGRAGTFRAFYWNPMPGKGPGRYYDEKGQALAKTLLKSPLRYTRVSSKFDRNRFHPILHRQKAHLGVDYAAPIGTPVWASSGGRVLEAQMKPGSGNTVVIAHGNGLATRYYHLSRFAKGLKSGQIVKQKEIIGFVGTTGLSTGPHLHFSVTKNGAFMDPSKLQISREAPVADRAGFMAAIRPRVAALKAPVVAKN